MSRTPPAGERYAEGCLRITELARAYERGETTPAELVEVIAGRIALRGGDGVWISLDLDRARADAAALGDTPDPALPLWGIPFAVKDNIDVAGWPTTAACPAFAHDANESATAVRLLVDAGAILIGKTNLDQFATGLNGTRSPYGIPTAVADGDMISGGSSSGSAVAVAAGLVSFALGTDTAGSGRVPAAFNGIVGWKPSRGLVSTAGVVPACRSLDCVSVFAMDVADAVLVARAISCPDPNDPWSRPLPSPAVATPVSRAGLRVGIPNLDSLQISEDHGYRAAWASALEDLRAAEVELVPLDLSDFFEAGRLLYEGPWLAERLSAVADFLAEDPDAVLPVIRQVVQGGARFSAVDAFRAISRLEELRSSARETLGEVDVLLTPTAPTTFTVAEMHEDPIARNGALGLYTTFGNLLDLAAIAVPAPAGHPARPFGVSLLGVAGSDASLASVAAAFEEIWDADAARVPLVAPPALPIAVVGAHLEGMPLHSQLTERGARLRARTATAPEYRFVALDTVPPKPGLVRVGEGGIAVEVEVWEIPHEHVGTFVAGIQEPLGLGSVRLADGTRVHGFLCEEIDARDAPDIGAFGGWRAYVAHQAAARA